MAGSRYSALEKETIVLASKSGKSFDDVAIIVESLFSIKRPTSALKTIFKRHEKDYDVDVLNGAAVEDYIKAKLAAQK